MIEQLAASSFGVLSNKIGQVRVMHRGFRTIEQVLININLQVTYYEELRTNYLFRDLKGL